MRKQFGKEFYIAAALIVIAIFFVQRAPHGKSMPLQQEIFTFPTQIGAWQGGPHQPFEAKIMDILRVDDYLNRYYYDGSGDWMSLYIGYFRDQISGETIHSPRNCMPGAGWNFTDERNVTLEIAGERPVTVHAMRSVLVNGDNRMLTYYWYQSRGRFLTNEYWHKVYMVLDALRYNRTDEALVRVLTPIPKGGNLDEIEARVQEFIRQFTPPLYFNYFPPPVV